MPLIAPPRFLIDEIVLVDVLAFFLSIATVFFLWYVLKKTFPDEVKDFRFLLTFIIAIVPFVILVYFGAALINYNAIAIRFDWPEVSPLSGLLPPAIVAATVFYIGQTVWLWWDWRKLRIPR
jgi:amino acid transporter